MRGRLDQAGYRCVSQVVEHGEFAVRGSLLDLYPMGSALPFRIDLLDEEVESIRTFDPDSQRTLRALDVLHIHPVRETIPTTGSDLRAKLLAAADRELDRELASRLSPEERLERAAAWRGAGR